jgi:hypothetical protein
MRFGAAQEGSPRAAAHRLDKTARLSLGVVELVCLLGSGAESKFFMMCLWLMAGIILMV